MISKAAPSDLGLERDLAELDRALGDLEQERPGGRPRDSDWAGRYVRTLERLAAMKLVAVVALGDGAGVPQLPALGERLVALRLRASALGLLDRRPESDEQTTDVRDAAGLAVRIVESRTQEQDRLLLAVGAYQRRN